MQLRPKGRCKDPLVTLSTDISLKGTRQKQLTGQSVSVKPAYENTIVKSILLYTVLYTVILFIDFTFTIFIFIFIYNAFYFHCILNTVYSTLLKWSFNIFVFFSLSNTF